MGDNCRCGNGMSLVRRSCTAGRTCRHISLAIGLVFSSMWQLHPLDFAAGRRRLHRFSSLIMYETFSNILEEAYHVCEIYSLSHMEVMALRTIMWCPEHEFVPSNLVGHEHDYMNSSAHEPPLSLRLPQYRLKDFPVVYNLKHPC